MGCELLSPALTQGLFHERAWGPQADLAGLSASSWDSSSWPFPVRSAFWVLPFCRGPSSRAWQLPNHPCFTVRTPRRPAWFCRCLGADGPMAGGQDPQCLLHKWWELPWMVEPGPGMGPPLRALKQPPDLPHPTPDEEAGATCAHGQRAG